MENHFVIINGKVRFDGNCEETRPYCGAVCCKNTLVILTEEEKASGKYDYVEPTEGCNCRSCQMLASKGGTALRRQENGCIYLDGSGKCSIYDDRPSMCKFFDCSSTFWGLTLPMQSKSSMEVIANDAGH